MPGTDRERFFFMCVNKITGWIIFVLVTNENGINFHYFLVFIRPFHISRYIYFPTPYVFKALPASHVHTPSRLPRCTALLFETTYCFETHNSLPTFSRLASRRLKADLNFAFSWTLSGSSLERHSWEKFQNGMCLTESFETI